MLALLIVVSGIAAIAAECSSFHEHVAFRRGSLLSDGWVNSATGRKTNRGSLWADSPDGARFSGEGGALIVVPGGVTLGDDFGISVRFEPNLTATVFFTVAQLVSASTGALLNVGYDPRYQAAVIQSAELNTTTREVRIITSYAPIRNASEPSAVAVHVVGSTAIVSVDGTPVREEIDFSSLAGDRVKVYIGGGIRKDINPAQATVSDMVVFSGRSVEFVEGLPFARGADDRTECPKPRSVPPACSSTSATHRWSAPEFTDSGSGESISINTTSSIVGPILGASVNVTAPFGFSVRVAENATLRDGFLWLYNNNIATLLPNISAISFDLEGKQRAVFDLRGDVSGSSIQIASDGETLWFGIDGKTVASAAVSVKEFEMFQGGPLIGASVAYGAAQDFEEVAVWVGEVCI
jgi:hypothetical protein